VILLHDGTYYMVPETHGQKQVRLYEAAAFPLVWRLGAVLLNGVDAIDATPFRHNERWYMLVSVGDNSNLHLYTSGCLQSGWKRHPRSPICTDCGHSARPAGPVASFALSPNLGTSIIVGMPATYTAANPTVGANTLTDLDQSHFGTMDTPDGGHVQLMMASGQTDGSSNHSIHPLLMRFGQECTRAYGWKVHSYVITDLSPTTYHERHIGHKDATEGAVLEGTASSSDMLKPAGDVTPGPSTWNAHGMHHLSAVPWMLSAASRDGRAGRGGSASGAKWLVAADGWIKGNVKMSTT
jgi:hypothetical protein